MVIVSGAWNDKSNDQIVTTQARKIRKKGISPLVSLRIEISHVL